MKRSNSRRITTEQFKDMVSKLVGEEYLVLGDYTGIHNKIKMKHVLCGNIYKVSPSNFIHDNNRCPECAGFLRKTNEQFIREVHDLVGDEYSVLTDYENNCHKKILMRHEPCGFEYEISPNKFTSGGRRCPRCMQKERYALERVKDIIFDLSNGDYELISDEYINRKSKLDIKHIECGLIYKATFGEFSSNGNRCPRCSRPMSKGEELIHNILKENNIRFLQYIKFDGLVNERNYELEVDFYLPDLDIAIEYDGEQHFKPFRSSDNPDNIRKFKNLQENDKVKNWFFNNDTTELIRFNYKHTKAQITEEIKKLIEY